MSIARFTFHLLVIAAMFLTVAAIAKASPMKNQTLRNLVVAQIVEPYNPHQKPDPHPSARRRGR